jgi:hypothetical protein
VHRTARGSGGRVLSELSQLGAVQLVRLAKLMDEPDDLARVADDVGRKLRRDHQVNAATVDLLEVEQSPQKGVSQDLCAGVPLERNAHERDLVVALPQLLREPLGENLSAAVDERHLRETHRDSHALATRA